MVKLANRRIELRLFPLGHKADRRIGDMLFASFMMRPGLIDRGGELSSGSRASFTYPFCGSCAASAITQQIVNASRPLADIALDWQLSAGQPFVSLAKFIFEIGDARRFNVNESWCWLWQWLHLSFVHVFVSCAASGAGGMGRCIQWVTNHTVVTSLPKPWPLRVRPSSSTPYHSPACQLASQVD